MELVAVILYQNQLNNVNAVRAWLFAMNTSPRRQSSLAGAPAEMKIAGRADITS
jgi:hypothetical protein